MRTFILFHDYWPQYLKADLLAATVPVDGFVVIRKTRPWWGAYLWKRARRIGLGKVVDEALLRVYWLVVKSRTDHRELRRLMDEVKARLPPDYVRPPIQEVNDINSVETQRILEGLAPDVCVLMVHPILKAQIFGIPRLGMLVFHPGVTPEYRGPHSAFWATLNNEYWGIGWSLLRVNKGIDTGTVLAQATTPGLRPEMESHIVMQHKAHVDGIPAVGVILEKLSRGENPSVDTSGRQSTNYTHPGLSDYLRLRRVLDTRRREQQ